MKRTIALVLSYSGTNYHGWQTQANSESVQTTLANAASSVFNEDIHITGCGRTDSGVHAKMYVASLSTSSEIPLSRIPYALNSVLPSDISISRAVEVSGDFHPVHSCTQKEYTYYIYTDAVRNPFWDKRALHFKYQMDLDAMKTAAKHFVGTHDFASMRSLGTPVKSTVRTVFKCEVNEENSLISITISANGFLYNMARTIAGTLLDVATGKIPPDDIPAILESGDRSKAGATAPAHALYMTNVIYPSEFGL